MADYDLCPECGYGGFKDGYCYECDYGENTFNEQDDDPSFIEDYDEEND